MLSTRKIPSINLPLPAKALISPNWPAPENVKALQSTRLGGVSHDPFNDLNLGDHVNDDPAKVLKNRHLLTEHLPNTPLWLKQIHSTKVLSASAILSFSNQPEADASFSQQANEVCTVMTADCLPVLFCNKSGTQVAAAHAGWRGLADGILEKTLQTFDDDPADILAWFGPAIGPSAFEVGDEVRQLFCDHLSQAQSAFMPSPNSFFNPPFNQDKWLADIYKLARQRLECLGLTAIYGGEFCTYTDNQRFFSYRRDGLTGRMASCIWLESF